ncbi:hypothetical protein M8C21_021430 [Ambrosia artemisiifolia]|uniref:non-specific serine/threonine protein kinase n=1 Tax=Ambrosia artemisiifolia TaxID=4212 RepID=A0AAD5GVA2_AMBAR|nr:hypothetical protein M8C21_021430 [Ambrosia artemisiifolia]
MKLGKNFLTGRETYQTSWRSTDDPSPGPYNGITFSGWANYAPYATPASIYHVIVNQNEIYITFTSNSNTTTLRTLLTPDGKLEILQLKFLNPEWTLIATLPVDYCDIYGVCGSYGSCNTATSPNCGCLKGFELKHSDDTNPDNNTSVCTRSTALDCGPEEGFQKFSSMKLPDTENAVYRSNMSLLDCEVACKNNCSCTAYANPDVTPGGDGCLLWFGDLIDVRVFPQNGQDLYVRLAASELSGRPKNTLNKEFKGNGSQIGSAEVSLFSLAKISRATNDFSVDNKLGEGGFGPVYKGVLEEGHEIAVKRLSKSSVQGLVEFENEVTCVAKLQHRNLVKLLGYCIKGDEKMLIYEYLPNKSLDYFLFADKSRKSLLDWSHRFNIIHGIARGLLYLHQDSRLKVVHRDLKAGNILLDYHMCPKISDFGLARMFKEGESEANTKRVVGTL